MISVGEGDIPDYALEFLLAFDGRIHRLEQGYWLKFEIKREAASPERPHGLRYSLTLHDPKGKRLLGFDNAHGVAIKGNRFRKPEKVHDHWHRTDDDKGRPYNFVSTDQLLVDFQLEIKRVLEELNIGNNVVKVD